MNSWSGLQVGDRLRRRKRGRGNNADYGLIVHIKPDATNKKTPEVSVLWRCADGKDDLTLVEDSHELDKLLGYRNAFRDVHADVDKPAPPLTFDYSYLVSTWYASPLSFATVQPRTDTRGQCYRNKDLPKKTEANIDVVEASGGATDATAAVDASPEDSRAVAHGQGGNASVPESTLSDGEVSAAQQLGAGTVGEARCTGHA